MKKLSRQHRKWRIVVHGEGQLLNPKSQNKLGEIFFAMPNEIQVQILCFLEVPDILSLRLTSKSLSELLQLNASVLSRIVLNKSSLGDDPFYLKKLYQPPLPIGSLDYFLQMIHREGVVLKMVSTFADYVQIKVYQVRTTQRRKQFAPGRERMEKRLKASTFLIYHFLEKLRASLKRHSEGSFNHTQGTSEETGSFIFNEMQMKIINWYPEDMVLPAFQFFRVLVSAFRQKLRPPTYAGTIERKLRGWDRTPATDADVAQVLIYGGMEEVLKIMSHLTYGARLEALSLAILRINGHPLPVGSRWMEGSSNPPFMRELDISPILNIKFMSVGSNVKLTALYSPWLRALLAQDQTPASTDPTAPDSRPYVPSPFDYIENLLKDDRTGSISGEDGMTVEDFSARAEAPDEDEEHADDAAVGPANNTQAPPSQHHTFGFPTQYG
jgi:F-box domain